MSLQEAGRASVTERLGTDPGDAWVAGRQLCLLAPAFRMGIRSLPRAESGREALPSPKTLAGNGRAGSHKCVRHGSKTLPCTLR
jgi:hypothetical protein